MSDFADRRLEVASPRSSIGAGTAPRRILALAVTTAVVAGGLEAVIRLALIAGIAGRQVFGDGRLGWMAPLGYGIVLLPPALLLAAWASRDAGRRSWPVAMGFCLFVAVWGQLLLIPRLHPSAPALVALGVAIQGTRVLRRRPADLDRLLGWAAPGLTVGVVGYGLALALVGRWAETRRRDALPTASTGAPNVLLIVWDTVRRASLSLHGYHRPTTPELAALARESVVFDQAWSTAPWTLPAHGSLLTGLLPQEFASSPVDPIPADRSTLQQTLAAHGFVTAGFVANSRYAGRRFGVGRGFLHFEDWIVTPALVLGSAAPIRAALNPHPVRRALGYWEKSDLVRAPRINRALLRWLDRRPPGRPFFAMINYFDAHDPYLPPPPFDTLFGADPTRDVIDEYGWHGIAVTPEQTRSEQASYDAAIRFLDATTRALLDSLGGRGLLDNTLVVITSDHGEQFGERGLRFHSNSLYPELLGVPLIVRLPGRVPAGRRIRTNVSLRDVAATILDLVNVPGSLGGSTLRPTWEGPSIGEWWRPVVAGTTDESRRTSHAVIRSDGYFVDWQERTGLLFDPTADPNLMANLLDSTAGGSLPPAFQMTRDSLRRIAAARRWR
ncbi:MAG: sulfatase-like hydrolase/transferase [Gemmatimonadales bacterium]